MRKTLHKLEEYITLHPERCFFNPPTDIDTIERVEMLLGIVIPLSYRGFLLQHNGGCICPPNLARIAQRDGLEAVIQECVFFFGIDDIFDAYQALEERVWREEEDDMVFPAVPMCSTQNGEILVFAQALVEGETPIFDAFHEEPLEEWGLLAPDFIMFLEEYIATDGQPKIIASAHNPTMEKYLPHERWKTIPSESVEGESAVLFWQEWLKFRPGDTQAQMNLCEALQSINEHHSALFHLQSLAKRDPDDSHIYEAMAYSNRETGNYAQALENIDTAIAIESGGSHLYARRADILFIMGRTEEARESCWAGIEDYSRGHICYYMLGQSFFESGDIDEALAIFRAGVIACSDEELLLVGYATALEVKGKYKEAKELCDRALGLDDVYMAALIARESINRKMGDIDAANADAERIEELLSC